MRITTAAPEQQAAAFALALEHLGEGIASTRVLNALTLLASGQIDPAGIFLAHDESRLCGVQVCVPLAGAGALFWLPKSKPANATLEDHLVRVALNWLRGRGTKVAQALVSAPDAPGAQPLVRCGFRPITRLHYLEHPLDVLPPPCVSRLRFSTYSRENAGIFHATLMATYGATLDCPELTGVRTVDEIIAGHVAQGKFRPERWWLGFEEDRPVGVAMVTEAPDSNAWDLSYLGLVPSARRRGLGREMTCHVLRIAQASHAPKLILAVDARNRPAAQLYQGLGFLSVDFREVYLYLWDRPLA
jgi:mycothiol synthase